MMLDRIFLSQYRLAYVNVQYLVLYFSLSFQRIRVYMYSHVPYILMQVVYFKTGNIKQWPRFSQQPAASEMLLTAHQTTRCHNLEE
jgi:hypothetical protein